MLRRAAFTALATLAAFACRGVDRLFEGPVALDARLSLALESSSVTVPQGGEQAIIASVTRVGEFSGEVTVSVEGLPPGVAATVGTPSTVGQVTKATVTVRVSAGMAVGQYLVIVRARANQVPDITARLDLTIVEPPSFSLTASRSALSVIRGGIAPTTVKVARTNLASPITLAIAGPPGISAAFAPNPAPGDSVETTVSVASSVAPGIYTVTIRGTVPGAAEQTTPVSVTVLPDATQLIASPELTTAQGSRVDTKIIINRTTAGDVALSAENMPPGVTASFQPATTTGASATLTLAVDPGVAAGVYPITLRAKAAGVTDATAEVHLTVAAVRLTLALDPPAVSVFQAGTSAVSTLRITRTQFAGSVSVAVEGASPGVNVTVEPTVAGSSSTVSIGATAGAAPGPHSVTIRATPSGFPASASSTVTLNVEVRAAPTGTGNVMIDWSSCSATPDWVAVQDGSGPWTQVLPSAGVVRFNVSSGRGGFAFVDERTRVSVIYMTQSELTEAPIEMCPPKPPTKTVIGDAIHTTSNSGEQAAYNLGGGTGASSAAAPNITIQGVRHGVHDLVGWSSTTGTGVRGLIVRDMDVPDGGSFGTVSWVGAGSFTPQRSTLNVLGFNNDATFSHSMNYVTTAACTVNPLYTGAGTTMFGVPEALQRPTDYHLATLSAGTTGGTRIRTVSVAFHTMFDRTVGLPPIIGTPTVSSIAGSYKMLRVFLGAVPAEYNRSVVFEYADASRLMSVKASLGYLGTSFISLAMPDLSGASGWQSAFAMTSAASGSWSLTLEGGGSNGPMCAEGERRVSIRQRGSF